MKLEFHSDYNQSGYETFPSGKTFNGLPKIFVGGIKGIEKPILFDCSSYSSEWPFSELITAAAQ